MATIKSVPTAKENVTMSIVMIPPIPMNARSAPAAIGAKTDEIEWARPSIVFARVYCSFGSISEIDAW